MVKYTSDVNQKELSDMSQEKVDKYKKEKADRKKNIKKQKRRELRAGHVCPQTLSSPVVCLINSTGSRKCLTKSKMMYKIIPSAEKILFLLVIFSHRLKFLDFDLKSKFP